MIFKPVGLQIRIFGRANLSARDTQRPARSGCSYTECQLKTVGVPDLRERRLRSHSLQKKEEFDRYDAAGSEKSACLPASMQNRTPEFIEALATQAKGALAECSGRLEELKRLPEQSQEEYEDIEEIRKEEMVRAEKEVDVWRNICRALEEAVEFREALRMVDILRQPPQEEEWYKGANRTENIECYVLIIDDSTECLSSAFGSTEVLQKSAGPGKCSVTFTSSPNTTPDDLKRVLFCLTELRKYASRLWALWKEQEAATNMHLVLLEATPPASMQVGPSRFRSLEGSAYLSYIKPGPAPAS